MKEPNQNKLSFRVAVLGAILFALAIWAFWGLVGIRWFARFWHGNYGSPTLEELGQVGDLFGGINALFAALAFSGVAVAAYMQRQELDLAHEQHTRQTFEPLFFQLLTLHKSISEGVRLRINADWPWEDSPFDRRISDASKTLRNEILHHWMAIVAAQEDERRRLLLVSFDDLYSRNEDELGPYFRSLYHIFKLVHESGLSEKDRIKYANIARALLGTEALFLLLVNCVSRRGKEFLPLVETYGLLKHLRLQENGNASIEAIIVEWFYKPTAIMSAEERQVHFLER
jgi:hypothetical protein